MKVVDSKDLSLKKCGPKLNLDLKELSAELGGKSYFYIEVDKSPWTQDSRKAETIRK